MKITGRIPASPNKGPFLTCDLCDAKENQPIGETEEFTVVALLPMFKAEYQQGFYKVTYTLCADCADKEAGGK